MKEVKISSLQLSMMMYPTILATAILTVPSVTAKFAAHDLWMSPILASFMGFVVVFIAVQLHKLYPEQTIIEYSEKIIGRIPGKIIGFFVLIFYLEMTGEIARSYSEFIVSSFLFKTPIMVIIALMLLVCAFAVYGGLETMARAAQLFFPAFFVPLIILIILLSPDFKFENVFPILEEGIVPPAKGAVVLSGWFAEFFLIAFFLPFLSDRKKAMKQGIINVLAVMITLTLVSLTVLFVLGVSTASKTYPLMNAGRYISWANFFENLDAVIMAVWILGAFVKLTVFYFAVVLGTAQWLNLSDYRPIVWPVGILIAEFSFWGIPNMMIFARDENQSFPFYSILIQVLFPLLLLMIAMIRKRKGKIRAVNE
ncbi:spore gernimation protein [Bacillus sp. FJAT-27231]|uniref:GerAB/ArcD/ProY family transporter n=1 Tax=Bacillus sp. FJAT-27231 TaxID=1679168 RepID=UPI000671292C|nr:endospore germination permease [Bacillus sp. FJAT-27231]KMY54279.1 spore gernimation protein [Bacillus sp. FJAT-27231]